MTLSSPFRAIVHTYDAFALSSLGRDFSAFACHEPTNGSFSGGGKSGVDCAGDQLVKATSSTVSITTPLMANSILGRIPSGTKIGIGDSTQTPVAGSMSDYRHVTPAMMLREGSGQKCGTVIFQGFVPKE